MWNNETLKLSLFPFFTLFIAIVVCPLFRRLKWQTMVSTAITTLITVVLFIKKKRIASE